MYRIFSVLVKPRYSVDNVIRLFNQCKQHCTKPFEFIVITDRDLSLPEIISYNLSDYDLDTWWNKMLIFHPMFVGDNVNLYFDLDTDIRKNIDDMFDQINDNILVVDAFWKKDGYFRQVIKNPDAFLSKGNTSIIGWKGDKTFLWNLFYNDKDTHTLKHFGDDTFINRYGDVGYFKNNIYPSYASNSYTKVAINHKQILFPKA